MRGKSRTHRNCGAWLCRELYRREGLILERPEYLAGRNICLIDGSEAAAGGGQKKYYLLHYCIELFTLGMRELQITSTQTGKKLANFSRLGKDNIAVADRAYGTKAGIEHLRGLSCDYVVRLRAKAFDLYTGKKHKLALIRQLQDVKAGESKDIPAIAALAAHTSRCVFVRGGKAGKKKRQVLRG